MAKVFISHASEDHTLAGEVHDWLTDAGHEVFLDCHLRDGIAAGEEWERRLYERLLWADTVVCVVTSAYLASLWCTAELGAARSRSCRLLPVRVELGVVHPLLTGIQAIDYGENPVKARVALLEALRRVDLGWPPDRSPFPGLRPFEADQHRVFFGRTQEVEQLVGMLRSPNESTAVLVVGPSGGGKSSFIRAGLVPVLNNEPDWLVLPPILPDADPVTALARELAAAAARRIKPDWTVERVRQQLDQRGLIVLADELLLADPRGPRRRLLIVVDQFEELFTKATPGERHRFTELLCPALTGPVRVVATLRSECLGQLRRDPDLAAFSARIYTLNSLGREALRTVIEQPALLAGIQLDNGLVNRLVEDTGSGQALPLLACTLAQFGDGVTSGGRLSNARYDQLRGVHGVLTSQADAALADAITAGRTREQVIAGLLRLVSVDELGRPTSWQVNRTDLPEHVVADLNAFVSRRLLTTDTNNDTVVIGVAHEALLTAWLPLSQAVTQNASGLRARRAVEHAAAEWHDSARTSARLWSGGQLAAAVTDTGAHFVRRSASVDAPPERGLSRWLPRWRRILVTGRIALSSQARAFLHASIRRDRRRRKRLTTVLSVLLVLALTAAGIAVVQGDRVREQLEITTALNLIAQAETVRDGEPRTALLLGIAAQHIHPGGKALASLVRTLTTTRYAGTLQQDSRMPVKAVAFTRDGHILATGNAEGTVTLWSLNGSTRSQRFLTTLASPVTSLAFSPDARTLVTASSDGAVILWDLSDPKPRPLPLPELVGPVNWVAFSPDGETLAIAGNDKTVTLWEVTDPTRPQPRGAPLTGHAAPVLSVAFSADGRTLATGDSKGTVILWDLTGPARLQQSWLAHTRAVNSVTFSPDGDILVTAGDDSTAKLWDLTAPVLPQQRGPALSGHTSRVTAATLSRDGHILATSSDDNSVIGWDITDPIHPQQLGPPLTSHSSKVTAAAFASNDTLATACADGVVILWKFTDPVWASGSALTGQPSPVDSVEFAPDGRTLATTSSDGTVTQWDLTNPERPVLGLSHPQPRNLIDFLAVTPDGNTMVTVGDQNSAILWDRTDPNWPRPLGKPLTGHRNMVTAAVFSADGHTLATGSDDGDVMLWDLTNRNRPGQLLRGHHSMVAAVAFSADGHTLATGHDDGQVILWDLPDDQSEPRPLGRPLMGHSGPVTSVAFAPDGSTLAVAGSGTSVDLWDLNQLTQFRTNATGEACAITQGGLKPEEWNLHVPGLPYQDTCAS